nr:cytochrome b-561 {N-terminal} [Rhodobacter capsulatus, Peptide Partial, 18 aa] [Rhodobacter capsulatus]
TDDKAGPSGLSLKEAEEI